MREWHRLGQSCTLSVFLAGSVHAVLLVQKTKPIQNLSNPGVRSLGNTNSWLTSACLLPGKAHSSHRADGAGGGPNSTDSAMMSGRGLLHRVRGALKENKAVLFDGAVPDG